VAQEPIVIPPLSEGLVIGRIEKSNGVELPREVLIEPLRLGTPGAYVARVTSRVFSRRIGGTAKPRQRISRRKQ
jgi:hypothetical protein